VVKLAMNQPRPIHPFPARMAPSIVMNKLPSATRRSLTVLDPMVGSGTTLVTARSKGHKAVGCDTDPLAVLISKVWCGDVDQERFIQAAEAVAMAARERYHDIPEAGAYPSDADDETQSFIKYWFDATARKQLKALAEAISETNEPSVRNFLWCTFSRLIITKKMGASLAMDVSHSRPHKVYKRAPINALDRFEQVAARVAALCPFDGSGKVPQPKVYKRDARDLPFDDGSIDVVITSPPYLNAIDYLRGHRMSLVWMGYKIGQLRKIRSSNVGAEVGFRGALDVEPVSSVLKEMGVGDKTSERLRRMLARYVHDMDAVMCETARVLTANGQAVFVMGDSTIGGTYIRNSKAIAWLGKRHGLGIVSTRQRQLPNNRRYLPPPTSNIAGEQLGKRMREEVILSFRKTA